MRNHFRFILLAFCITTAFAQAGVSEFRLDQNRLWLTAQEEPLSELLEYFAAAGIDVQIDPAAQKMITGSYNAADVETVLDRLLPPYSYLLDWRRETGPLGQFTRLNGIRVFREGYASSVKPLRRVRRIETSLDGKFRFMTREILIGFKPGASMDTLRTLLVSMGGTVIAVNAEMGIYRILLPEGANVLDLATQLGNDGSIALAEPNYVYDVPRLLPGGKGAASAPAQWNAPTGDRPIAVAVLDTGLLPDGNLNRAVISAFDATNPGTPLTADAVGHGTLMAQLAAGLLDPYCSPVGEGVSVVAVKAFEDDGTADSFTLMNAMTYAVKNSTGPISLSWGSEVPSSFIEYAVQYAIANGHSVYAAVGNGSTDKPMYPAACHDVVGVASSDGDRLADYSNYGDSVDIIAPGSVGNSQGTSVSAAYVAHLDALYRQNHPDATVADVISALKKAAGPTGFLTEDAVKRFLAK